MRLIVPGASGFIGRNLMLSVPSSWDTVALYHRSRDFPAWVDNMGLQYIRVEHCDLNDRSMVQGLAAQVGSDFDACVFLAANGDPGYSVGHPFEDLQANVGTLIHFLTHFQVGKLLYFSSGAVYDGSQGLVSPEIVVSPNLPYAISNWACEHYVQFFAHQEQVEKYVNFRFFGAYGPYEPSRKIYSKLVRRFAFERKPHFTIHGDGRNFIDAMYVGDTVRGVLAVLDSGKANFTVDFCSGAPMTIDELVHEAARTFGLEDVSIRHVGSVPEYINFHASSVAMERLFHFRPEVPLENGLRQLAEFLKHD